MSAFVELKKNEFAAADSGLTAVKHQCDFRTSHFDGVCYTSKRPTQLTTRGDVHPVRVRVEPGEGLDV